MISVKNFTFRAYPLLTCIIVLYLASCATSSDSKSNNNEKSLKIADVSSEVSKNFDPKTLTSLSVLPVMVSSEKEGTLGVPDIGLTDRLITSLQVYTQLEIETFKKDQKNISSNSDKANKEVSRLFASSGISPESLFKTAEDISESLGGSPVLYCFIINNKSMTGGGAGAEVPSDVEYRMWLYDGKLGQVVWSSAYRSKQRAVTENLFSIGDRIDSGIGFSQVNDLLSSAFRASAKKLDRLVQSRNQNTRKLN
jgi:hypothetical protein